MGGGTIKAAQPRELKEIVEEWDVTITVNSALIRFERAEDVWDIIKFVIARDPTVGEPHNEPGTIRSLEWPGARSTKMPSVVVLYRIEETQIVVFAVDFFEAPYEREGHA